MNKNSNQQQINKKIVVTTQRRNNGAPKNKKQKRKRAQRRIQQKTSQPTKTQFQLSKCSLNYAVALTDPFKVLSDVCIPDLHDLPSWKLRTLTRGTFYTGTQGVGYIVASSKAATNNNASARRTAALYDVATITPADDGTKVIGITDVQFPYPGGDIAAGVAQVRTAAIGVRARYIGSELNKAGRMILFRFPTDQTASGYTADGLLARQETISMPVSRAWRTITYIPQRPDDYDYVNSNNAITELGDNQDIGIMCDGATAGSNLAYEYEIVRYHELISGTSAVPNLSMTHSDVAGLSAIRNSLEGSNFEGGPSAATRVLNLIKDHAPTEISHFVENVGTAINVASSVYSAL